MCEFVNKRNLHTMYNIDLIFIYYFICSSFDGTYYEIMYVNKASNIVIYKHIDRSKIFCFKDTQTKCAYEQKEKVKRINTGKMSSVCTLYLSLKRDEKENKEIII